LLKMAKATCDFFIENTPTDGIPYWDTGALNSHKLGEDVNERESDPFNDAEPIVTGVHSWGRTTNDTEYTKVRR